MITALKFIAMIILLAVIVFIAFCAFMMAQAITEEMIEEYKKQTSPQGNEGEKSSETETTENEAK